MKQKIMMMLGLVGLAVLTSGCESTMQLQNVRKAYFPSPDVPAPHRAYFVLCQNGTTETNYLDYWPVVQGRDSVVQIAKQQDTPPHSAWIEYVDWSTGVYVYTILLSSECEVHIGEPFPGEQFSAESAPPAIHVAGQ